MSARRRALPLLLTGAVALGAALAAGGAEPDAAATRIGRYRIERSGGGIALSCPRDRALGLALLAGGLVLAGLGQGLRSSGRPGAGGAALVLGLGLAAVGGLAATASPRWRADPVELVREGLAGRRERWPRAALVAVEVVRRPASAEELKRTAVRPWDVRVRGADGRPLPVRFALDSEADARALARALAEALGLSVEG